MPKTMHKKRLAAVAKPWLFMLFFGVLVLILPVFYLPQALDRTLAPRLLLLAVLLLVSMPFVFNKGRIAQWDFSIWRQSIFPVWGLFFLLTIFSAIFALNPMESYFFIVRNFLFLIGLAMGALILHNTPGWHKRLPQFFIVAAGIALIFGIGQYYFRIHLPGIERLDDGRASIYLVTGLFSHKSFFSTVLALMLPFTLFGIYKYRSSWQAAAIITSAGIFLLILILRTRSVWVGLMAGTLVAVIVLLSNARGFGLAARWRLIILAVLLAGVTGVITLFNLGDASDEFSVAGRMRSIFDTQSQHNIHRLFIWNASLEIIKEEPLTGVGAGNWLLRIPKHFNRNFEHLEAMGWRQPHNDYIWIAAEKGIFSLLIYLAAFGLIILYLFKVIRNKGDDHKQDDKVLALLLMSGITAYMADAFFSFPYERIDVMVFLMIIMGSAIALYHANKSKPSFVPKHNAFRIAGYLGLAFSVYYAYSSLRMEQNIARALTYLNHRNFEQVLHYADAAKTPLRSLGPHLYPAEFLEGVACQNLEDHQRAVASFEQARKQAPYDIRILHMLGSNYRITERHDEAYDCFMELVRIYPPSPAILRDIKLLVVDLSVIEKYEAAYNLLVSLPNWEDDPEIVRNVNALKSLK